MFLCLSTDRVLGKTMTPAGLETKHFVTGQPSLACDAASTVLAVLCIRGIQLFATRNAARLVVIPNELRSADVRATVPAIAT